MLENSPHLCFAKQAPLFWRGSSVSWKKKKRSWDACGKQLARLIVGRSHILYGHDRRSIRKDLAFHYLEKVPLLSHLGKNIESCIFHCQAICALVHNNGPVGKCTRHQCSLWPPWEVPTPFLSPSNVFSSAGEVKDVTPAGWRWDSRRRRTLTCSF